MSAEERIAWLEGRAQALEECLERRSKDLRRLQQAMGPDGLLLLSRILNGLPPLPQQAYDLEFWAETTRMTPGDVDVVLEDLWRSLTPIELPDDED